MGIQYLNKFILGVWNVGVIENHIEALMDNKPYTVRWMQHSFRDRFFADPFLLSMDDEQYHILAEEYPFSSRVGYISLLNIRRNDMKLLSKKTILKGDTHYSYPFVYDTDWIIPENFRSGSTKAYKIRNAEVVDEKLIMNHGLIDQTLLEFDGKEWLFATDEDNKLCGLKIYYKTKGEKAWHEHQGNPVSTDIKSARPGGHFFSIGGNIYRPVQDSEVRYGHQIHIMRIDVLNEKEFVETEVATFNSKGQGKYSMGFHTFNVEDGIIVCDGYREYHSYVIKPLCIKMPWLMNKLNK